MNNFLKEKDNKENIAHDDKITFSKVNNTCYLVFQLEFELVDVPWKACKVSEWFSLAFFLPSFALQFWSIS